MRYRLDPLSPTGLSPEIETKVVQTNGYVSTPDLSSYQQKLSEGAFVNGDKTKLDGIETGADVTDATNVASAGAVMDGDFSANGVMTRTAAGTYTSRTITGTTNQITVTNGDGVSGNPTLALPQNIHTGASPTFAGVTTIPSGSSPTLASPYMGGSVFSTTFPANTNAGLYVRHASNTATNDRPIVGALRSRGTLDTPTAVANGDDMFSFLSAGFDGTDEQYPAEIKFVVDGTVAAGSVPTCITLRTGANGAGRITNLRVNSNGTTDIKQLQPFTDSTYTNGTPLLYWKETYTDKLFLNSTATLDGSTAGSVNIVGGSGNQLIITNTVATERSNIQFVTNGNDWEMGARGSSASNANQFYLYDNTVGAYRLRVTTDGNVIATKTISASEYGVSGMLSTFSNEASFYTVMPNLQNDIMYNDLRGGSVTWTLNGGAYSPSSPEQAFRPGVDYTGLVSTANNDTFVCEVTTHSTFAWAGVVGHAFYSHTGTFANVIKSVKAEIYLNGAWVTIYDTAITASDGPVKYAKYGWGTNTPGVTKLRYTFVANGAGTSRLTSLFWIKYNSNMLSETYLDKSGGSLYGTVTMSDAANLALGTTTGTKIGTATNQKLGFYNATPVVRPSSTPANATDLATAITLVNDLKSKLVTLGLIA